MKIIDANEIKQTEPGAMTRLASSLGLGKSRSREQQSQDVVVSALGRMLGGQYTLLRDVKLEGLEIPIPLILVGPQGVRVLAASGLRGVYRVKAESWERMDEDRHSYEPARPNLVTRTLLMAQAVQAFLAAQGHPLDEVEPVLVFTNPGVHVETARPLVRVLQMDALERYISGVLQSRTFLSPGQEQVVVELLSSTLRPVFPGEQETGFAFAELEDTPAGKGSPALSRLENLDHLTKRVPFSTRQIVLLGLLVLVNVILLAAFLVMILRGS